MEASRGTAVQTFPPAPWVMIQYERRMFNYRPSLSNCNCFVGLIRRKREGTISLCNGTGSWERVGLHQGQIVGTDVKTLHKDEKRSSQTD